MTNPKEAAVQGRKGRIYEYTNEDGVTFWSFTRLSSVVSPAQRLRISSRVGTQFDNHMFELRSLRKLFDQQTGEIDESDG
jgi:hypothetical protein